MRKVLISLLVFLVALAVVAVPVGAKDGGPLAVAVDEMDIEVSNFNFGLVTNFLLVGANSGLNFTFGPGADVDTGNAKITAGVSTGMNSNSTGISVADYEWGPFAVNLGFDGLYAGEGSVECLNCPPRPPLCRFPMPCWMRMALGYWMWSGEPVAIAWDRTSIEVSNFNLGFVDNDLILLANTGLNFTYGNSPKVDTGNAEVTASVENTLNTNTTNIRLAEGGVGPVAVNFDFGIGAGSECFGHGPLAVAVESDEISVHNFNLGFVDNDILAFANSGLNYTYGKGADVKTGDAEVKTTVGNTVNTNSTTVTKTDSGIGPIAANIDLDLGCGGSAGVPCLPGGGIGPVAANVGTSGIAVAVEADNIEVSNTNVAVVTNTEILVANTGGNTTVGCSVEPCRPPCPPKPPCGTADCGGEEAGAEVVPPPTTVDTGDATVTTTVTNTVNTNSTTITVGEGTPMVP